MLQLPLSLCLPILQVISEVGKVRVDVRISECCLFIIAVLGLEVDVVNVIFSVSILYEVLTGINAAALVRGNLWQEAGFLHARHIKITLAICNITSLFSEQIVSFFQSEILSKVRTSCLLREVRVNN